MKHTVILLGVGLLLAGNVLAAGKYGNLDSSGANVFDRASVQRGAATFMNYCASCHGMKFKRYQRLVADLGLSEEEVLENLAFGEQTLADYIKPAMRYADGTEWFGKAPPDLSLTARSRSADWIYSFLRGYYLTDEGWANTVLENPAMPHVLWEMQGIQRAMIETVEDNGSGQARVAGLQLDQPGLLSPSEYDQLVRDVTAFMIYAAEPAVLKRYRLGVWVMLFLALFTFLAYLLYVEYWRDVKK